MRVTPRSAGRCHAVTKGTSSVRGVPFSKGVLSIKSMNFLYKYNGFYTGGILFRFSALYALGEVVEVHPALHFFGKLGFKSFLFVGQLL